LNRAPHSSRWNDYRLATMTWPPFLAFAALGGQHLAGIALDPIAAEPAVLTHLHTAVPVIMPSA
jgi:hypothetical protein